MGYGFCEFVQSTMTKHEFYQTFNNNSKNIDTAFDLNTEIKMIYHLLFIKKQFSFRFLIFYFQKISYEAWGNLTNVLISII